MRTSDPHRDKHAKQRLERPLSRRLDDEGDDQRELRHRLDAGPRKRKQAPGSRPSMTLALRSELGSATSGGRPRRSAAESGARPSATASNLPVLHNEVLPQEFSLPGLA
jgi:hypothetical protein